MNTNDQRIRSRVAGRENALTVVDLAKESCPMDIGSFNDFWISFWEVVRDEAKKALVNLGYVEPQSQAVTLKPMPDNEARVFSDSPMPFGKYADLPVWQVLDDDPGYLDWLVRATEADQWKESLRRYLARDDIQQKLPEA